MRDKARFVNGSATLQSRRKTIAFEMQQLAHEDADAREEQKQYEREQAAAQADFDEVVLIMRTSHAENRLRRQMHTEVPRLAAAE